MDLADLMAWQRGYGTPAPNATKADGDADEDLDVDGDDLAIWQAQFGYVAAPLEALSGEQAVAPEEGNDEALDLSGVLQYFDEEEPVGRGAVGGGGGCGVCSGRRGGE